MTNETITATIREVLAAHGRLSSDVASVGDDENLYRLGLASHATVNVVMALEDELDIEIPDELLVKDTFTSISSIRDALAGVAA